MMICQFCKDRDHLACKTPNCCCAHRGSPVRPLTGDERHAFMHGRETAIVKPRETE